MDEQILVSPLGLSPGAVSGVAFGLQRGVNTDEGLVTYPISRVVTLGTSNPRVREAAGYLAALFAQADIRFEPDYIPQPELRQEDDSVGTFVARLGTVLEAASKAGDVVHVAITGGRSGMGALAALATSLYGADHLWHLWVTEEIELKGRIGELPQPFDMHNIYLNPPPGQYELVELPFLNMRPLHPILWDYYRQEALATDDSLVEALLQGNFIRTAGIQMADIFPAGATLRHKREVAAMTQSSNVRGPDQQQQLVRILQQAGLVDVRASERLQRILLLDLPPSEVLGIARFEEVDGSFWHYLKSRERVVREVVAAGKRPVSRSQLLQNLGEAFDGEELKTLCFDLKVDYDDLAGAGKRDKARELVGYMERRGRLPELVVFADKKRPHMNWFDDTLGEISEQAITEADLFLLYGLQMWLNYRGYGQRMHASL